jgi:8-oxo-dGTP pyrophosphatase MutT (NUDIX family)
VRSRLRRAGNRTDLRLEPGDDRTGLPPRGRPLTPAAVLVGLVGRESGPSILLTQRTPHLTAHAGQISLPGGRAEPGDADPVATALRAAEEEIGLDPGRVEILAPLPPYETVTGFRIEPVVGWIEPPVSFAVDPFEVAELFEVPLSFVLDAANHRRDSYVRDGRSRHFYVLPYDDRYIWGATAGILVSFARLLAGGGR